MTARPELPGLGHNRGPAHAGAPGWQKHCWRIARESLLPTLPIEVVRLRVARARELGLDYRTYAGVRATTGRDIVAFLFSNNALAVLRPEDRLPADTAAKLRRLTKAGTLVATHRPVGPGAMREVLRDGAVAVLAVAEAPVFTESWSAQRQRLLALLAEAGQPADGVVMVGSAPLEADWVPAARLAAYVPADRYFAV